MQALIAGDVGYATALGAASAQGIQIAMEEIRVELKLEAPPDPARAFDWSFVQK